MKTNIPKMIHFCWFGGTKKTDSVHYCIDSWRKFCPDYKIIEWNEDNYDITQNEYMYQAYKAKKWGFVPDYARLDIIYNYGGIYLDTDVELVRNLDNLLYQEGFAGFESEQYVNLGEGFGAIAGNKLVKSMRDEYKKYSFIDRDNVNLTPSPVMQTEFLVKQGLRLNNKLQIIDGITIYPSDYFCPKNLLTQKCQLTENTYSIHHFDASWWGEAEKKTYTRQKNIYEKYGVWGWRLYNGVITLRQKGLIALINKIKTIKKN